MGGGGWNGAVGGVFSRDGGEPLNSNWQNKWPLLGLHGGKGFVTVTLPLLLSRFWMFHGCYSDKLPQLPASCLHQPGLGHILHLNLSFHGHSRQCHCYNTNSPPDVAASSPLHGLIKPNLVSRQ